MILILAAVCSVVFAPSFAKSDMCTQLDNCLRNVDGLLQTLGGDHLSLNEKWFKHLPANMTKNTSKDLKSYYKQFDQLKNLTPENEKNITSAMRDLLQSLKEMQKHFKNQNDQKPKTGRKWKNSNVEQIKSATAYVSRKFKAFLTSTKERACSGKPNLRDSLNMISKPSRRKNGTSTKGDKKDKKTNKKTEKTDTPTTTSFINNTKTNAEERNNTQKRIKLIKTTATTPTQSTAHNKEKGRKNGKKNGVKNNKN